MKKTYILLVSLTLITTACKKDFISLLPEDSLPQVNFFQTDAQLQSAAIAAYVPLRDVLLNDFFASEMHADNTHYQPSPNNRGSANVFRESGADWNNDGTNDYINAIYFHSYTGISRANILIGRIPLAKSATDAGKQKADGQAKFIRALNYYKLVRLFGDVPLYLKEVTKADEAFLPRSGAEQVYTQIIADCKDAIAELKPPSKFPQTGEATKGAATVLLADVYVTLKRYEEAETLLNTLPAMGYKLTASYGDAFKPVNKNKEESLFDVQYQTLTGNGSQPNTFPKSFLPKTANTTLITGDPKTSSNTVSTGGWNKPVQDLIDSYEPGDARLEASIAVAEGTYDDSYVMTLSANKSVVNYTPAPGKVGQPYIKKYLDLPFIIEGSSSSNWPIYRYAEALLLLAEALNEQGKSPLVPLNAVRNRAGLGNITETDKEVLRDIIFHERRVELAFENKRFNDLQRNPKGLAIMQAYAAKAKATYPLLSPTAFDIQSYKFLLPIPQPERGLNPDLTQNPGYPN
ncbi:RagB/SusD family nutrient uptake outer membrane protein [Niabella beijingensis]|uniref:RagB/SusD family nutrient uptake outer membrane protein n=1 Tax=Niabella beijingensis TaxID=2872700 RepID=UPI001CC06D31|nr:RagB/SusD family nutrient uptake outer membrane protein [Niabella beijingensis]MBZ4191374.1 RagB/SusD family nutrient uptake outer membrane protein [Niabella beijingensis]